MPVKASKVSKVKKVSKKVVTKVEEPAPVKSAPVEDVVVPAPEEVVNDTPYVDEFAELAKMADSFIAMARSFKQEVQKLEKRVHKEHKVLLKKANGKRARKPRDPNAPKSGFAKEGPVSDEMRKFLGMKKDGLISRTDVTKKIHEYCKAKDLQDPEQLNHLAPRTRFAHLGCRDHLIQ